MSTQLPKHSKENLSEIDFYCYFVRHFGSHTRETAGLLARKAKPRPQTPQGPVVFPQKPWWRGSRDSFNFDFSKTEMLQWLEWKEKDAVRKSK